MITQTMHTFQQIIRSINYFLSSLRKKMAHMKFLGTKRKVYTV